MGLFVGTLSTTALWKLDPVACHDDLWLHVPGHYGHDEL